MYSYVDVLNSNRLPFNNIAVVNVITGDIILAFYYSLNPSPDRPDN